MDTKIVRIVEGLSYNTATATEICSFDDPGYQNDFDYEETGLFQTPKGRFFLAGFGGPRSRWARQDGCDTTGGRGVMPVSVEVARDFAEQHADEDVTVRFFEIEAA